MSKFKARLVSADGLSITQDIDEYRPVIYRSLSVPDSCYDLGELGEYAEIRMSAREYRFVEELAPGVLLYEEHITDVQRPTALTADDILCEKIQNLPDRLKCALLVATEELAKMGVK